MSRPSRPLDGAPAAARAELPDADHAAFDRLTSAVLASPAAALGAVLRAQLRGTAGVRWLHQEGLPPTARATALTPAQWLSLYACWTGARSSRDGTAPAARSRGGRPSAHGHAPGAQAAPR